MVISPSTTKMAAWAAAFGSAFRCRHRRDFHDVLCEGLGKTVIGRAMIQARVASQWGSTLVTISDMTRFGMTA